MPSVPDIARHKQVAAENVAARVVDGMVLGLGSGSTAEMILVRRLAGRFAGVGLLPHSGNEGSPAVVDQHLTDGRRST
jgi:ribose 5-phosphate isomerase